MTAESPQAPLTDDAALQRLVESLKGRNVETFVAEGGEAARELLVELVPPGAELYKGTSETWTPLDTPGTCNRPTATAT